MKTLPIINFAAGSGAGAGRAESAAEAGGDNL
jgi:hypothetical protein